MAGRDLDKSTPRGSRMCWPLQTQGERGRRSHGLRMRAALMINSCMASMPFELVAPRTAQMLCLQALLPTQVLAWGYQERNDPLRLLLGRFGHCRTWNWTGSFRPQMCVHWRALFLGCMPSVNPCSDRDTLHMCDPCLVVHEVVHIEAGKGRLGGAGWGCQ